MNLKSCLLSIRFLKVVSSAQVKNIKKVCIKCKPGFKSQSTEYWSFAFRHGLLSGGVSSHLNARNKMRFALATEEFVTLFLSCKLDFLPSWEARGYNTICHTPSWLRIWTCTLSLVRWQSSTIHLACNIVWRRNRQPKALWEDQLSVQLYDSMKFGSRRAWRGSKSGGI